MYHKIEQLNPGQLPVDTVVLYKEYLGLLSSGPAGCRASLILAFHRDVIMSRRYNE